MIAFIYILLQILCPGPAFPDLDADAPLQTSLGLRGQYRTRPYSREYYPFNGCHPRTPFAGTGHRCKGPTG